MSFYKGAADGANIAQSQWQTAERSKNPTSTRITTSRKRKKMIRVGQADAATVFVRRK